ncbi:TIGR03915 family putative DNA repair protein [bacterium]|nr:TIGR03915 family putative DNA repair protein [bacterium]
MIFLYDGTFEGFLSTVFDAFLVREDVEIAKKAGFQPHFFTETREVETLPEKAERVASKLLEICGERGFTAIVYIFLSEEENCETYCFYLIKAALKNGKKAFSCFQDERIARAMMMRKKVSREYDKMLGLLRFSELANGIFYAPFEPDFNLIPLLVPHFYERLSGTRWMIHDLKRGIAVYHAEGKTENVEFIDEITSHQNMETLLGKSENEDSFEKMWSNYFKIIAIESRINPKLQLRFVPQRYWKHLTERKIIEGE